VTEAEKGNWKGVGQVIYDGIDQGLKTSGGADVIGFLEKFGIGPAALLVEVKKVPLTS